MLIHKYNPTTKSEEPVTDDDFAGGGGGGGLSEQETANALATAPQSEPAAGSNTAYLKQIAEGGGNVTLDGTPASLPLTITLTNGTERIVGMSGAGLPRSIGIEPASGDTVTVKYRYSATGAWFTLSAYTAIAEEELNRPIQAYSIQRTAGSGTTSKMVIA